MCDSRNRSRKSLRENTKRFFDTAEIKQEPDIKEEPQPNGNLATVSAQSLDNRGDEPESIDHMESDDDEEEHATSQFDNDDVKIEVKNECDKNGKKEKAYEPESNVDDQGELNEQENEQNQSNVGANNPHSIEIGFDERSVKNQTKAKEVASKQHQCTQCGYAAKYKSLFDIHLRKHTGDKPFACKHCSKSFTQKHNFQSHMIVHAKEFLFNCSVCLQGFNQKNEKMEHEGNCKALRYECHVCKKSFGSKKTNLIVHMRVHSGERPFACTKCPKKFALKGYLNRHMEIHLRSFSWKCIICRQGFPKPSQWKAHQRSCSRRIYECCLCKKFIGSYLFNLKKHILTHTGEKPFQCQMCRGRFTQKSSLTKHMKRIHNKSC